MPLRLLLTGAPGIGKTTVLRKLAGRISGVRLRGFLTDEIRVEGRRVGFKIETLDGDSTTLAHVNIRSRHRVGRYRVDVQALERVVDQALHPEGGRELFLIDEIGKMECLSSKFVEAVWKILESNCAVVATIARRGGGFIESVKRRPDVELWEVTQAERDNLPERILDRLSARASKG